jgi:iron complex outermembrane receptor protein
VQDDLTVVENRLHLIVGSKFEHNDLTGFEEEPSARLAWTPTENQTVWAAVSRAVRTPAELERDVLENRSYTPGYPPLMIPPVLVKVSGSVNLDSEELTAYELGYRIKPVEQLSFDVATFYNVYDRLITPVQGTPYFQPPTGPVIAPLTFENAQHADTYGTEISGEWRPLDDLKFTASYTYLQEQLTPANDFNNDPKNQFQIHSYLDLPHQVQLDAGVYYVNQITPLLGATSTTIPSYVRLDLGMTWRPAKSLEIGIFGQNLAQDKHPEFTSYKTTVVTEIPRSIMGRVSWSF